MFSFSDVVVGTMIIVGVFLFATTWLITSEPKSPEQQICEKSGNIYLPRDKLCINKDVILKPVKQSSTKPQT